MHKYLYGSGASAAGAGVPSKRTSSFPPLAERRELLEDLQHPEAPERLARALDPEVQWYLGDRKQGSIDAVGAWRAGGSVGDPKITVGFIDDGFDVGHPNLSRISIIHSYRYDRSFQLDEREGCVPGLLSSRTAFHGTPCLGIALGIPTDGRGIIGVAPGCSAIAVRWPVRHANSGLLIGRAFEKLSEKCDVICLAFHPDQFEAFDRESLLLPPVLKKLAKTGGPRRRGIVICASAGNESMVIRQETPADYSWTDFLFGKTKTEQDVSVYSPFAASPFGITVAASSAADRHSDYSNFGSEVTLCAPSNDYERGSWRKKLRLRDENVLRVPWNRSFALDGKRTAYRTDFGGTSAATAIVAGAAALVRSVNPRLRAVEVIDILGDTAEKIVQPPDGDSTQSFGEYGPQGRSYWFGHGRLNLRAAVEAARSPRYAPSR